MTAADDKLRGHLAGLAARANALLCAVADGDEQALAAEVAAVNPAALLDGDRGLEIVARRDAGLLLDAASEAAGRLAEQLAQHEALARLHASRAADAEESARAARAQLAALERVVVVPLVEAFGAVPKGRKAAQLAGDLARVSLQRTRPHVVVDAAAVVLLPADCRRVTVAADKDAIKLRLERGEALPGCSIEQGAFRVRWGST